MDVKWPNGFIMVSESETKAYDAIMTVENVAQMSRKRKFPPCIF